MGQRNSQQGGELDEVIWDVSSTADDDVEIVPLDESEGVR
jgi:hypothetical protein